MNNFVDSKTLKDIAHALWLDKFDENLISEDLLKKIFSEKNSNKAFGQRFKKHIEYIQKHRLNFTAPHTTQHNFLLQGLDDLSVTQFFHRNMFVGDNSIVGYEPISPDLKFEFPRAYAIETKYQNVGQIFEGIATDSHGDIYSIRLQIFQSNLLSPKLALELGLSPVENTVIEPSLSIVNIKNKKCYFSQASLIAGTSGLSSFENEPRFKYKFGKNIIESYAKDSDIAPLHIKYKGYGDLDKSSCGTIELKISLVREFDNFLNGNDGHAPTFDGIGIMNYSIPRLRLDNTFQNYLKIDENQLMLVDAKFFYQRSYYLGLLPHSATNSPVIRALSIIRPGPSYFGFNAEIFLTDEEDTRMTLSGVFNFDSRGFNKSQTMPGKINFNFFGVIINQNINVQVKGIAIASNWIKVKIGENSNNEEYFVYPTEFIINILDGDIPLNLEKLHLVRILAHYGSGIYGENGNSYQQASEVINNYDEHFGYSIVTCFNFYSQHAHSLKLCGLPNDYQSCQLFKKHKFSLSFKILSVIYLIINLKALFKCLRDVKGRQ